MANNIRDSGRIRLRESAPVGQPRRRKLRNGDRPIAIAAVVLLLLFLFSAGCLVPVNPEHRLLAWMLEQSRLKLVHFLRFLFRGQAEGGIQFITYRHLIIVLAGASLAAGGAVYNGVFRNILASPTVLGVQSGGGLGNILYVLLFVSNETRVLRYSAAAALEESYTLLDRNLQQAMVLAGCFLAVFLVVGTALAAGRGRVRPTHLILSGMIFSSLVSGFTGLVQYYLIMRDPGDLRIQVIRNLSMGSFDRAFTREHFLLFLTFQAPCLLLLLLLSRKLDALALGEEEALSLGIPVRLFRNCVIVLNTIMTGTVIAFCGQIGFVGFIVPQAARRFVGPGLGRLLPMCMCLGGILLLLVYDAALLTGMTGYINLFTSAIGSAGMVVALMSGKGVRHGLEA